MGDFRIKAIINSQERNAFYRQVLKDLEVFDYLLANDLIDKGDCTIGAEQELTIIDQFGLPKPVSLEFLEKINDAHYTNELAKFDLEINLDPITLQKNCFSVYEKSLLGLLGKGNLLASELDASLYLTGILPTIVRENLEFEYMTPIERYKVLSNELLSIRGNMFEIFLQGVDDLHLKLGSILFEACNTSFQSHLQINPDRFKEQFNWAQMISGPVLAVCTNSPILFGKELWSENRIALFKQSLDTRNFDSHYRQKEPRVYFGKHWFDGSPSDLWKNDVARFPLIFRGEGEEDSDQQLRQGITPLLRAVRLHNGTTYTWNRLCYGVHDNKAHIRIECRYMPAGPTPVDEIANMAFWVGLMKAMPEEPEFWKGLDFRVCVDNFYRAARTGIHSVLNWYGKRYTGSRLINKILIPLAEKGLSGCNIDASDIQYYLNIIRERAETANTGSEWQIRNFRMLTGKFKSALASKILVKESLELQRQNIPVAKWPDISTENLMVYFSNYFDALTVADIMSTELYTLKDDITIEMAAKVMEFRKFHHVIIENQDYTFMGVLSKETVDNAAKTCCNVIKDLPLDPVQVVNTEFSVKEVQSIITQNPAQVFVVMERGKVVGIVTEHDL